jgi:hypothetical protein
MMTETAASELNVPCLKQVLTKHQIEYETNVRRNVLVQLYEALKANTQKEGLAQELTKKRKTTGKLRNEIFLSWLASQC